MPIPFTPATLPSALTQLLPTLSPSLKLLALGEPLHNNPHILLLRNQIFQHLVEHHHFTAIALESSFPRARALNALLQNPNATPESLTHLLPASLSHNFATLPANRDLLLYILHHNQTHPTKLAFYGFDSPTEMVGTDSPRTLLTLPLNYLTTLDPSTLPLQQKIDSLLGPDAPWENPQASFNPHESIGLSPSATALRIETENLLTELLIRRPTLIPLSSESQFLEALHYIQHAQKLLTYHAGLATDSPNRIANLLALRDLMMAENLTYLLTRETLRAPANSAPPKLFVHAHNSHLQRSPAHWQLGPHALSWHPAGAHLHHTLGPAYSNIATALTSAPNEGLPPPEPNTLEHLLSQTLPTRDSNGGVTGTFIPTQAIKELPTPLPPRSPATKNSTYFPLTEKSLTDFNCLALLNPLP